MPCGEKSTEIGRVVLFKVAGRMWLWERVRWKEVLEPGRSGDGRRVDADCTERRECGDTGGVGGRRDTSAGGSALVNVACVSVVFGVGGGVGSFDPMGTVTCK